MTTYPKIVASLLYKILESDPEDQLEQDLVAMVNRIAVDDESSADKATAAKAPETEEKYKESEVPEHHCNDLD